MTDILHQNVESTELVNRRVMEYGYVGVGVGVRGFGWVSVCVKM